MFGAVAGHGRVRLIVQNPDDRAWLARRCRQSGPVSRLIRGSGVDLTVSRASPPPPAILLPARLLYGKGVREFVAAAWELRLAFPRAWFVLVGES